MAGEPGERAMCTTSAQRNSFFSCVRDMCTTTLRSRSCTHSSRCLLRSLCRARTANRITLPSPRSAAEAAAAAEAAESPLPPRNRCAVGFPWVNSLPLPPCMVFRPTQLSVETVPTSPLLSGRLGLAEELTPRCSNAAAFDGVAACSCRVRVGVDALARLRARVWAGVQVTLGVRIMPSPPSSPTTSASSSASSSVLSCPGPRKWRSSSSSAMPKKLTFIPPGGSGGASLGAAAAASSWWRSAGCTHVTAAVFSW
mmetsp:Transcript_23301/g.72923  ORF Transcript_23301/g.72923 Transcript_23301/m.72923 type:complete len:255 (+) Transcript_23301:5637-6401(+)